MVSRHYKKQRYKREKFINRYCNGDGEIIDEFIVDKGHKNGLERHCITNTGIIIIYNIARPNQVKRYYKNSGREPPSWLLDLCKWHEDLNYNK